MRIVLLLLLSATLVACPDEKKRPIGGTCGGDSECESGLCLSGECLDPAGDEDGDGLTNGLEGALGSNPMNRDSDYDGVEDGDELAGVENRDTDSDGAADIIESLVDDGDGDCLPDELDADHGEVATDLQPAALFLCGHTGVCRDYPGGITVTCGDDKKPICGYTGIAQFQADETTCDGLDNDCDGRSDEGSADRDGDGSADCVDSDLDGDGAANTSDNCAELPNGDQGDADNDELGDACDAPTAPLLTGFAPTTPANVTTVLASGDAEPMAEVAVYADPKCSTLLGEGAANGQGAWQASVTLQVGDNTFAVRATNPAGLTSPCAPSELVFTVDQEPPVAPVVHALTAVQWGEGDADFLVTGQAELGGSVQLFADAACASALGAPAVSGDGHFSLTVTVPRSTPTLYAHTTDTAGNVGPCAEFAVAFGPMSISVTIGDKPLAQIPVQFHYPDGTPAGPVDYTDNDGKASVEGFAGYGVTVATFAGEGSDQWVSVLGLVPGQVVPFERGMYYISEEVSVPLALSFTKAPANTSWIKVIAPCGYFYVSAEQGASQAFISPGRSCFHGSTFDIAVIAMDYQSQPIGFLVKEDVPVPPEVAPNGTPIVFEGDWRVDFLENRVEIEAGAASVPFELQCGLESGGDSLDYQGSARVEGFAQAMSTGAASIAIPAIAGLESRWEVRLGHLAQGGVGLVGFIGGPTPAPFDLSFSAVEDFLPHIYRFQPIFPVAGSVELGANVPVALEWDAEPGLAETDTMIVEMYVGSPVGSIDWRLFVRPSEAGSLMIPTFERGFPNLERLDTAYYTSADDGSFYDAARVASFDDLFEFCPAGGECGPHILGETRYTTCCGGNDRE